ncbi:MAG: cyanophycinase [Candidatus Sericytochromatia bacterium]|nr:cyanophycinase [Candidatus Sericytochromatia bacterium]
MPKVKGRLILIGGEQRRTPPDAEVMARFAFYAGGVDARITILAGESLPRARGAVSYRRILQAWGARDVSVLVLKDRQQLEQAALRARVANSTGILLVGDDPHRLHALLSGSALESDLLQAYRAGASLAGVSGGAALLAARVMSPGNWVPPAPTAGAERNEDAHGLADVHPRAGLVKLDQGLGFLQRLVVDHHYCEKQRQGRLLAAVAAQPEFIGVGVDAGTALVIAPQRGIEVVGKGAVAIFDGGRANQTQVTTAADGQLLALCRVQFNLMPAGFAFAWKRGGGASLGQGARISDGMAELMAALATTR